MADYRVQLDAYSGPLDLLLYLVKRHEVDLHDIPIAMLTDQFMEHLKLIQEIDIETAADFLVLAATLMEIKSQMLVPRPEGDEDENETDALSELDPRYELVQQLLEYKRFKDATTALDQRREDWSIRYALRPGNPDAPETEVAEPIEFDLEDVHVLDLCEAFSRMLETIGDGPEQHKVIYDDTPIALHADDILDRLRRDGPMTLQQIFIGRNIRTELIGLFLATLELVKQFQIRILQDAAGGEIQLELVPEDEKIDDAAVKTPDWTDPETGQVQYEWPSEQVRQAYEKRSQRRADRLSSRRFDEADDDEVIIIDDDYEPDAAGGDIPFEDDEDSGVDLDSFEEEDESQEPENSEPSGTIPGAGAQIQSPVEDMDQPTEFAREDSAEPSPHDPEDPEDLDDPEDPADADDETDGTKQDP